MDREHLLTIQSISRPTFIDQKNKSCGQMTHGIFYGILIAFIGYFAVLAIRLKNRSGMWFTLYIFCLGLLMSSYQGDLQQFPRLFLAHANHTTLITMIGLLYFTGAKLLRTFLSINVYSYWL